MRRIASRAPTSGVIVDLGCGHGLFTQLLARELPGRDVIGIDLDAHKIAVANQVQLPNLRYLAADIATAELPPAQAVTILDVLYLVPFPIQEQLLAVCADRLAPGGVILLKEMAELPRWKVALNWLEETLAVRVLGITDHSDKHADQADQPAQTQKQNGAGRFYFRPRADWQALFDRLGFNVETVPLDRGYYHPHVLFVARKR